MVGDLSGNQKFNSWEILVYDLLAVQNATFSFVTYSFF